jgi:hypothetical protein
MKHLFLAFLVFLGPLLRGTGAWAKPCEVFGISDSPQKLTCVFRTGAMKLTCQQGTYYLDRARVTSAYHLEVEDGPVPLVFKGASFELVVYVQSKTVILAELERGGLVLKGQCR